jgi:hypothetical protein
LKNVIDSLKSYSINDILEEYLLELCKILSDQKQAEHQPMHHVDFDAVMPFELERLEALYRKDFIKIAEPEAMSASMSLSPSMASSSSSTSTALTCLKARVTGTLAGIPSDGKKPHFTSSSEKEAFEKAYKKYSKLVKAFENKLWQSDRDLADTTFTQPASGNGSSPGAASGMGEASSATGKKRRRTSSRPATPINDPSAAIKSETEPSVVPVLVPTTAPEEKVGENAVTSTTEADAAGDPNSSTTSTVAAIKAAQVLVDGTIKKEPHQQQIKDQAVADSKVGKL